MKIITNGLSRIVFIFGDYAVKIPWINLYKLIKVLIKNKEEGNFEKKASQYGKNRIISIFTYFLYVILANRREYLFYLEHKNEKNIVPIIKIFLWGLIIVQPKANKLSELEIKKLKKIKKMGIEDTDLLDPENFGNLKGKVVLLDYASKITQKILILYKFNIL
jgi:hypothetical protein